MRSGAALVLAWLAAAPPAAWAAEPAPKAPPALELGSPVIPGRSENAEAAFRKLAAGKDYVERKDTKGLEGFDQSFVAADANRDSRLDWREFQAAWRRYGGA